MKALQFFMWAAQMLALSDLLAGVIGGQALLCYTAHIPDCHSGVACSPVGEAVR
jgi:hypothetical protein